MKEVKRPRKQLITYVLLVVLAMLLWRILTYYFGMFAGMFALMIKPDRVHEPD